MKRKAGWMGRTGLLPLGALGVGLVVALLLGAGPQGLLWAGPERITLPPDYATELVIYQRIDRPDRDPAAVRFMYTQRSTLERARPGEPLPEGSMAIMEDHVARTDAAGRPVHDARGRLVPTDEVTNLFVMQKSAGWGADKDPALRNGDWEYAWFNPDGSRKEGRSFEGCFHCHLNRAGRDYTYTLAKYILDTKGP